MTKASGAITLDFKEDDIYEKIRDLTGGVAPMLALTLLAQRPTLPASFDLIADRPNVAPFMGTERPHGLCQAIQCCRDFGPVSLVGVNYGFQQIMDALSDYLRPFVRVRRERPGEDLISEIVGSVIDDEMLTEDEGVEASMVVLTGGFVRGLDDREFADPMKIDFDRRPAPNSTFGNGVHRCPGSLLAHSELETTMREWLLRIPEFRINPNRQPTMLGGFLGAVRNLELQWDPASTVEVGS